MKKLAILLALCVALCLVFVSCGDTGSGSETGNNVLSSNPAENEADGTTEKSEVNGDNDEDEVSNGNVISGGNTEDAGSTDTDSNAGNTDGDDTDESNSSSDIGTGDSGTDDSDADEGNTDNGGEEEDDDVLVEGPVYTKEGDKVYFGTYPQTAVSSSDVINALNTKAGALPTSEEPGLWTDYQYYANNQKGGVMWYVDLIYKGEMYRGVYFAQLRPNNPRDEALADKTFMDEHGYSANSVAWFKYEPIAWSVVSESDGALLIVCDMVIDSQSYDYDGSFYNGYENSTIRAWLNENFYNTAFNDLQKELILTTTVDNSAATTAYKKNEYESDDTEDRVFLLSYKEAKSLFASDAARMKLGTDYAKSQGANAWLRGEILGCVEYWLRSPYNGHSKLANTVATSGVIVYDDSSDYTYVTSNGVVPALRIQLPADAE